MKRLLLLLLLAATPLFAQPAPRERFPSDYTPHPCAPANSCRSFAPSEMKQAAYTFLGLRLDSAWLETHAEEMIAAFAPICRKQATCLATQGNTFPFCNDSVVRDFREMCDTRFPKSKDAQAWDQCRGFTEVYVLGVDQHSKELWDTAQACAREKTPLTPKTKPPIVWIEPAVIPPTYDGHVTVFAIDPDTKVPVQADFKIEGQTVYAPSNPTGKLGTYYPFRWPIQYKRVRNAAGHEDLAPPNVTVTPEGYPPVTLPMPARVAQLVVELRPEARHLRVGKNTVTVHARDAETSKPVEARVMVGSTIAGTTNEPFVLELKKGGRVPEIWVTSLFDRYSDTVVVPATK